MRKRIFLTSIALLLIIAASFNVYTQTLTSNTVKTDETVSFLLQQNQAANELIEKQKNRIADLENELIVERENSASIGKSYESARIEISALKSSNEALTRAVALNEQTIELLKADNTKQRDKAKQANKAKWKAYAALAGVIALKFLIP